MYFVTFKTIVVNVLTHENNIDKDRKILIFKFKNEFEALFNIVIL